MSKLPFIAALLLAFASGCVAETDGEDDGAIEELWVDDGHSPDGHAPDVQGDEPVHIPTDATTQRHDPPPNPWQPDEGLSEIFISTVQGGDYE